MMYHYNAKVLRWIDGDTVVLLIDMGFYNSTTQTFRLRGVDTPERGQPGYQGALDVVNTAAPAGTTIEVTTYKPDKYGRWLVDIGPQDDTLNQLLIRHGLGQPYSGGAKPGNTEPKV